MNEIVYVKIAYGEIKLANAVKKYGGIWNKNKKLWEIKLGYVLFLNIEDRIVK